MSKLEDLRTNASVKGILPDALVTVVSTQWYGSEALELTYKTAAGRVANERTPRPRSFAARYCARRSYPSECNCG